MSCHATDFRQVTIMGANDNQLTDTHVADGPGGSPDIFRKPRAEQNNGYVFEVDSGRHQRMISNRFKKYDISKDAVSGASEP